MRKIKTSALKGLAVSLVVAFVASGCASSGAPDATSQPSGGGELTAISVGSLPVIDMAPIVWADDKGIFEQHGLDVTLETLQGGPVGVQKVATNELQFSFANQISTMIAQDANAPVVTLGALSALGDGALGIFVKDDSPVQTIEDLNGLTIAVNTVNNVGDVMFKNIVAELGLTVEPVWVEVPYPEIAPGIERGSVDAGFLPEPFSTVGREAGLRMVVDLTDPPNTSLPVSGYITNASFAASNPEVVAAFQAAIEEARQQISDDEAGFREWWPTVSQTTPEQAEKMILPDYLTPLTVENCTALADQLKAIGLVKPDYNAEEHLLLASS